MATDVEERLEQMSSFRRLLLTSIISALALVVGLFWNDAIKTTIDKLVPDTGQSLLLKYVAAIIVTVVIVVIVYTLLRLHRAAERRILDLQRLTAKARSRRRKRI